LGRGGKKQQKMIDPEHGSVYIHDCHPFNGNFRTRHCAFPSAVSRIIWSLGSLVDALVRFAARQEQEFRVYEFPGRKSASLKLQKGLFWRAKARQDF
jgi:hypothetical protein